MSFRTYLSRLALSFALLSPLAAHAGPLYKITWLPSNFYGADINNAGQIAGSMRLASGDLHAALLSGGIVTDLGTLGGESSDARALNDAGAVLGVSMTATGERHAFIYQGGSMLDISAGTSGSIDPFGINAAGSVVGQIYTSDGYKGFVYSQGALVELPRLGTGDIGMAWDINDAGAIVGESTINPELHAPFHPFLYHNGTLTDLGTLADREINAARAINNAGQIAGNSAGPDGGMHAFLYENGVMTDLGSFGGLWLDVTDMNEHGAFVGQASTWSGPDLGFIYLDGKLVDLNTLVDPAAGWEISGAHAINDLGQILAYACHGSECGNVQLDLISAVPEPSAALLLLPGLLVVARAKRRARP